ncbi:MAG TPA: tRNA guanosine(34) transglycosylase Tgt [Cryomorphaceae bacterium]|jgi:queuine tRNA-ribosyltransferase|nr:MAG: queuine tRNA-ribosyltransferase [Cryomorphaceae bacterium BACL7 MAG-120910-bin2]KRO66796.1 MAG: queuine tRNA-ribosyltransferase [Cryomorphaceae bacterium BACL21 MAG-121220-bin10]KRO68848.1 MAG: queuine tRNA-ribosyltransferase [Cryomorphaceae bacterium BACL7 MAG-120322-bin74]NQW25237.1 tRNA guanosine(34) transglycosylase Tgt [Cryomorphaceae bacterium]HAG48793.1 tRNA guanosine(34) transglycosylase Tgt [Cryomorphaceae bacterium]|tara:strand:- start:3641 stop:4771 length:1131 start_codon:yes stop_codon:yes gene_type:complete
MRFDVVAKDPGSSARAGLLKTDHGDVPTPIFMPVGTLGTVKGVHPTELKDDIKAHIVLGNTYHLYLRPGINVLEKAGGLHGFTTYDGPMLTDSGGFQVHSLQAIRKISEEGVNFQSHIDGSRHLFTPESVMEVQRKIGADIVMAFDECTDYPCAKPYAREAMDRTHRWLDRCITRWEETEPLYGYHQALFPIVQGSTYPDLRAESAAYIASKNTWGNAIGGLSVGEPAEEMYAMADQVCRILPQDKPRYLMGVGTPANILENIALGVDMFDCVMPTRNARNGQIFTQEGIINLRNAKWAEDFSPLDPYGDASVDQRYSKAYMRHLFIADENLGKQIASIHNLRFYLWLVEQARAHIQAGDFASWKNAMVPKLQHRL